MVGLGRAIGQPRRRVEDHRLVTGGGAYIEDLVQHRPDLLHLAFVRSPLPSARIRDLHTARARQADGVVGTVTGEDVERHPGSLPLPGAPFLPGFPEAPHHPILAHGCVRFVGEPVVAVVAESVTQAADARDLVEVDYDPLPAVADLEEALAPEAPLVHAAFAGNLLSTRQHVSGDPEEAFAAADHVLHLRIRHNRLASVAMEPRGIVAEFDASQQRLTVWHSTQAPFLARADLARTLGLQEAQLHVIAPDVGGGFGAKVGAHPEDVLVCHLALQLRRPIAWVASRSEDMAATFHGRDMLSEVDVAARQDGMLLGLRVRTWSNVGAYALWHGPLPVQRLLNYATGCYRMAHLDSTVTTVLTNTQPSGPYRGAGRPEAAFVAEYAVEAVAAELGLDPVEVRRRNFIPSDAFPYATAGGVTYDSGNYERAMDLALQRSDYVGLRSEQSMRRSRGALMGIGLATYTESAGGGFETGLVVLEPDGSVIASTGCSAFGQGQQTTFAQIVADRLGVDPGQVRVVTGDTAAVAAGMGSFGSRSVALGGSALAQATDIVKHRALRVAANLLEAAAEDLELRDGRVAVRGAPERFVGLANVIDAASRGTALSAEEPRELRESVRFVSTEGDTFPFGAIVASVAIDPETARITLERLVLVDDCGRAISPLLIEGQLAGGAAQGIGEALMERITYASDGQLVSGSLLDYAVPRASTVPQLELDRTETPTPRNLLGAKGVGESATVGTPVAIANAVLDALRPFSGHLHDIELPITAEQVWRLLETK